MRVPCSTVTAFDDGNSEGKGWYLEHEQQGNQGQRGQLLYSNRKGPHSREVVAVNPGAGNEGKTDGWGAGRQAEM